MQSRIKYGTWLRHRSNSDANVCEQTQVLTSDKNWTTQGSITTFLYPFEIAQIQDLVSSNILLMQYWAGLKLNSSIFETEKIRVLETKVAKTRHMILFVFHFPAIWLVTLNKPGNLIHCFIFNLASSLAGNKIWFKAKNSAIRKQLAPIRANQITGTTSDFKMGVIKCGKWLIAAIVLQRFASHLNFCLENDCKWNVPFFLFLFIFINNIHGKLLTSDWLR